MSELQDEGSLRLYCWTGAERDDAANTCTPLSSYSRDLAGNVLQVAICHLSRHGMGGQ
jgi:hypothetical protein